MIDQPFTSIEACRSCGGVDLAPVLDLGMQPLANSYPAPDDRADEPRYQLSTVRCRGCTLVQLTGTVLPSLMFDNYPYFSSFSDTVVGSAREIVDRLVDKLGLGTDDLVIEVASNDGYLLQRYVERNISVLGVEPAANVAEVARGRGITTVNEYFTRALAETLAADGRQASVLHANNVMAHVPDINDFMSGIAAVLRPGGVAVLESPYLLRLIDERQFDTIYHEHVFYYSLTAVTALAARHGLALADVEEIPIHGGSLRLFLRHHGASQTSAVQAILENERTRGIDGDAFYADFAGRVEDLKQHVVALLSELKRTGSSVAAYGAAAKGTVLLNHFGVDHEVIDFVVDRNSHKQGRRMPGVGIPVLAPDQLLVQRPDYTVLLAWNFADEVLRQQQEYRELGGRFIVPAPRVTVI